MKKSVLSLLVLLAIGLTSCGGGDSADCGCNEITKHKGKFYRTGIQNDGERITFKELFTGSCEVLNDDNQRLAYKEYNNGYLTTYKHWVDIFGEYIQNADLTYKKGKRYNGYIWDYTGRKEEVIYVNDYKEYDNSSADVSDYWFTSTHGDYGNYTANASSMNSSESFCDLKISGYHGKNIHGDELYDFLDCLKTKNLKMFKIWYPKKDEN